MSEQVIRLPVLTPDCRACSGLCCVATAFARSADFAFDKPYGRPCRNLLPDFDCGIHDRLAESGFRGCVAFDCRGAGQHTTAKFGGRTWLSEPALAPLVFDTFFFLRTLHDLLWWLDTARQLPISAELRAEVAEELDKIAEATDRPAEELSGSLVDACASRADPLIREASAQARAHFSSRRDLARANLIGADLSGVDLRGADLSGASMLGALLAGADLRWADLRGTDLRGADVTGTDLSNAIFLHPSQLSSSRGTPLRPVDRAP
jgi:hypothetical protein